MARASRVPIARTNAAGPVLQASLRTVTIDKTISPATLPCHASPHGKRKHEAHRKNDYFVTWPSGEVLNQCC